MRYQSFLKTLFQLRTCTFLLSEKNINKGKFKVCLEYHIGNCKGPCANLQTEAEYLDTIQQVRKILKGNISSVIKYLKEKMQEIKWDIAWNLYDEVNENITPYKPSNIRVDIVEEIDLHCLDLDEAKAITKQKPKLRASGIAIPTIASVFMDFSHNPDAAI